LSIPLVQAIDLMGLLAGSATAPRERLRQFQRDGEAQDSRDQPGGK